MISLGASVCDERISIYDLGFRYQEHVGRSSDLKNIRPGLDPAPHIRSPARLSQSHQPWIHSSSLLAGNGASLLVGGLDRKSVV